MRVTQFVIMDVVYNHTSVVDAPFQTIPDTNYRMNQTVPSRMERVLNEMTSEHENVPLKHMN